VDRHDRLAAGDGIFIVAEAWPVYDIDNDPVALSLVGLAWTGGMTAFLLTGGIVSDRMERRTARGSSPRCPSSAMPSARRCGSSWPSPSSSARARRRAWSCGER
jgi:hypothetical protein